MNEIQLKRKKLICCTCGKYTMAFKQWWNRDTGYGVCDRCIKSEMEIFINKGFTMSEATEACRFCYGEAGTHHSLPGGSQVDE